MKETYRLETQAPSAPDLVVVDRCEVGGEVSGGCTLVMVVVVVAWCGSGGSGGSDDP